MASFWAELFLGLLAAATFNLKASGLVRYPLLIARTALAVILLCALFLTYLGWVAFVLALFGCLLALARRPRQLRPMADLTGDRGIQAVLLLERMRRDAGESRQGA